MLNKILVFLIFPLLSFSSGDPAMANGYDDARAGVTELSNGNNAEAIRLLTRALDSGQIANGDLGAAHFDRGLAWANSGEYDKAIADYSDAIRFNPHLVDAYHSRGVAWVKKGEYDDAITDFNVAIRYNAQDAESFDGRGVAWSGRGEYDKAVADFDAAIRLNAHDTVAYFHRGLAGFDQGKFEIAATDFAQKLQLSHDGASVILLYLSRARSGVADSAVRLAADSSAMDEAKWPAPAIALFLGKSSTAAVFEKAADVDANKQAVQMCEANFYSGEWSLLDRKMDEARDFFDRAVRQCPTGSWAAIAAAAEAGRM
jgi:tetratricopeptide (TPR) repeat protein